MSSFEEIHARLLKNDRLQFDFPDGAPPPPPPRASWLFSFDWGGSKLGWAIVAAAVALTALVAWRAVRQRGDAVAPAPDAPAAPPIAIVRATLARADELAAAGRFSEAAHALLACGVDEIDRRYPGLLRPATTSRDLVDRAGLPDALRNAFSIIAATVEKGMFGNRPVTAADYAACRDRFATSALAGRA